VRRRRLAAELKRLRGSRKGTEVARGIGWSPTKISRAESGRESIPVEEVAKLIDYYGVTEPLRGQLLRFAEDATQRGWWEDYADALAPEHLEFIGLEHEASAMADWQADVVPGLLQTEDYVRQINLGYTKAIPTPPGLIDQFVRVRMTRQERLTREPVLQLSVVIDQAVLLRRMGPNELMRTQLEHLAEASDLPNVEIRILPLDRDVPLVMTSFTILSFGSELPFGSGSLGDVVSTEAYAADLYIEGEKDTYPYHLIFRAFQDTSLSPAESRALLLSTARTTWS
jgi:hypothetical protein